MAALGAMLADVLRMAAHLALRLREPDLPRPPPHAGGMWTSGVALAGVALVAGLRVEPQVVLGAAAVYGVLIAYFALFSRPVAQAPRRSRPSGARSDLPSMAGLREGRRSGGAGAAAPVRGREQAHPRGPMNTTSFWRALPTTASSSAGVGTDW
ncbi:MAG: hypothetical protein NZ890_00870 [Myxococcota bacterium]|nr:hypothetical protein [Myxococcota bacterium]